MSKELTPAQLRKLPPRKRAKYKTLSKINSPVPSQLKELRNIIQEATVVRREPPKKPKIKSITDKYSPGKFSSPSTKKLTEKKKPLFKLRPDRKTTAKERMDKVDKRLKVKKKPINITTKPIKKRILESTTGSVSLPKKKLEQVPIDPPKKEKPISSVRKPKLGTKTGPYKAPEPKKESKFDLLKMLRKAFSPNETISTAKIRKALPDKTTTKQIKSLQAALKPTVKDEPKPIVKVTDKGIKQRQTLSKSGKDMGKAIGKDIKQRQTLSKSGKDMGKAIGEGIKQRQDKKSIDKKKVPVVKTKPIIETVDQANKRIRLSKARPTKKPLSNISKRTPEEIDAGAGKFKDTRPSPGTMGGKVKAKSLPAWANNPIAKEIIGKRGGTKTFFDKDNLSSWIGRNVFGEGDDVTPIDKMKTSVYNDLREEFNSDTPMDSDREAFMNTLFKKKGGKVGKKKKKKKQGYKSRKNESIAMRVKKKRTKKQLKSSRNESYGKWGKGKGKGKVNKVFRRGGGKALRGFGKATYSNKLY